MGSRRKWGRNEAICGSQVKFLVRKSIQKRVSFEVPDAVQQVVWSSGSKIADDAEAPPRGIIVLTGCALRLRNIAHSEYPLPKIFKEDKVCATDDDRSEQETIVYTVIWRETTYSQPLSEPRYCNALASYISPQQQYL